MSEPARLAVFFDGACPYCSREIAFYRRRRGADAIDWVDLSVLPPEDDVAPGLRVCDALTRFHVRRPDGALLSGAKAFLALWRALPLMRPIGWFLSIPPGPIILERGYTVFLSMRPKLTGRGA